ncbi:MAG: hypothetical protein Q8J64_08060 [Thermodesulfovibrionales bacterium]|nr:hypothetical protein [Thermodesulfovibrionales bacterium]
MTIAEKLEKLNGKNVVVRRGRRKHVIKDRRLEEAISKCIRLAGEIKEAEAGLKGHKEIIINKARMLLGEGGTLTFDADGASVRITLRREALIPPENILKLKAILGRRFNDLVRVQTKYSCSQALVEGASGLGVSGLIEIKELSPQLRWESVPGERNGR